MPYGHFLLNTSLCLNNFWKNPSKPHYLRWHFGKIFFNPFWHSLPNIFFPVFKPHASGSPPTIIFFRATVWGCGWFQHISSCTREMEEMMMIPLTILCSLYTVQSQTACALKHVKGPSCWNAVIFIFFSPQRPFSLHVLSYSVNQN